MNIFLEKIIRKFCLYTWRFWEMLGLHVIPNHFYWPIQDSKKLRIYDFNTTFPLDGINLNLNEMKQLLNEFGSYRKEYETTHVESAYSSSGDGAILFAMTRIIKPNKIIEVGSGNSTDIMYQAQQLNLSEDRTENQLISIEPYPNQILRDLISTSNIQLIEQKVELVDNTLFSQLKSGDLLFIDSSHVVDVANDVHFLYLHILPQLPVGVYVHIHDIRFPYEYPKEWVLGTRKHWAEQYLLHMFLAFNDSFQIIFASNYMYENERKLMVENLYGLSDSDKGWPGSFWIKRVK